MWVRAAIFSIICPVILSTILILLSFQAAFAESPSFNRQEIKDKSDDWVELYSFMMPFDELKERGWLEPSDIQSIHIPVMGDF